jgi:membrane-associated phospholipid phosphatase
LHTTEKEYLGLERSFTSIMQAAQEVSVSRLYGGIHYKSALTNGFKQGEAIARFYLEKIK